ncbi:MAG TPA: tyrosine-type recombinase/integrase [Longilinea sp.]|nr:tyrosine-type recombinase/integrase [Longilinea sp.]
MSKSRTKDLMMITLDRSIDLYLATLVTEGKSPRYIDWLKTRLGYFSDYIQRIFGGGFKLQKLDIDIGRDYLHFLLDRDKRYLDHPMRKTENGKLKVQYIHGMGRAIRSFCTWAFEEGYLDENVMRRLKLPALPKTLPEPLTEDEIELVLTASLDSIGERLRNFSIVMLFLDTGIRLDELVNLRISKVDFAIGEMMIFGKGSKDRKVPIGTQAKKALIDYISKERPDAVNPHDEDRLFLNADGFALTHDAVEKIFQRVKKTSGVDKFHPHVCRHTFSVRYLINGGDVFSLQKILGHTSLDMTRKYVNLASGDVKEKHRRFSPMDNLNFLATRRGRPKITKNR